RCSRSNSARCSGAIASMYPWTASSTVPLWTAGGSLGGRAARLSPAGWSGRVRRCERGTGTGAGRGDGPAGGGGWRGGRGGGVGRGDRCAGLGDQERPGDRRCRGRGRRPRDRGGRIG